MNIIFKVNETHYQLKGGSADFRLNRHNGMKEVIDKKTQEVNVVENNNLVGYFGNVFQALEHIIKDQALNNDATSLLELKEIYFTTINDIREIAKQFKLEG
jgi:hypothetical protein